MIRHPLRASVSALALAVMSSPAFAQESPSSGASCGAIADPALRAACEQGEANDAAGQAIPGGDESDAGEEIIVTGSRIRSTQFDAPNPVISVDSSAIQNAGVTNLANFLQDIPALVGSTGSIGASGTNAGIGGVGLNLLNLRNLGEQRTLVLIDGRRHVAAVPGSSSVDTSTFPIDLIERVDVLTGAASAVYGADAVTGVVNFITKSDFEGINARVQAGVSEEGDSTSQLASIVAGKNFAGGRGNIAVAFEYGHEDRLRREERRRFQPDRFAGFYENLEDAENGDDPNVPDYLPYTDVRYFDSSTVGAIDVDLDFVPDFIGTGAGFDPGQYIGGIYQIGGSGTPVATYGGELLPQIDRYVGNILLNYELERIPFSLDHSRRS